MTPTVHPDRCRCEPCRNARDAAARARLPQRVRTVQDLNGRLAEAGRILASTTHELGHLTSSGIAPGLLDVNQNREAAPATAQTWAARVAAGRRLLDELVATLGPLLDETEASVTALASELDAEWRQVLEVEAEERRQAALDAAVTDRVRQSELDRLAAVEAAVRSELTSTS